MLKWKLLILSWRPTIWCSSMMEVELDTIPMTPCCLSILPWFSLSLPLNVYGRSMNFGSDHFPILVSLYECPIEVDTPGCPRMNFKKADCQSFSSYFSSSITEIIASEDVHQLNAALTKHTVTAASRSTPNTKRKYVFPGGMTNVKMPQNIFRWHKTRYSAQNYLPASLLGRVLLLCDERFQFPWDLVNN